MSLDTNTSISRTLLSRFGILGITLSVLALIVVPWTLTEMFTVVDAHEIVVVQNAFSGNLSCVIDSGPKVTAFGHVTRYPRRAEYDFNLSKDSDNTKKIQFSDGGHANLDGAVNWEMPLDCKSIIEIHRAFGSAAGVTNQGISKAIDSAIYLSGPMMTSTEASGERKAELVELINDQATNGLYQTSSHREEQPDPITGEKKMVTVVEVAKDKDGHVLRQQQSILSQFNIHLLPISLRDIIYEDIVKKQIARRQEAATEVQIAQANARKAEQDAITIGKQGEASAAKAKWEQETENAKSIALAQKDLQVATLAAQQAEQYKKQQILRGEGEAEYKRLLMGANNALDVKLDAYVKVNQYWADAFAKFQGSVVPTTVFGQGSGGQTNAAQNFMEIVTAKAAKDLSMDLSTTAPKK